MTKSIVLLVHGMGTHAEGNMKIEFIKGLKESAEFLKLDNFNPDDHFEFHEYNYSIYLNKIRAGHAQHAEGIAGELETLTNFPGFATSINKFESKLNDDSMLYTHWLDVVYYAIALYREPMLVACGKKIIELAKLAKDNPTPRKFHIVAHSLGTAMVHDCLNKLYQSNSSAEDELHLDIANYRVDSLWMISNVSRLLHLLTNLADPRYSFVHDNMPNDIGIAHSYYPIRNRFDPFTWFKTYRRKPERGSHLITDDIRKIAGSDLGVNPHSLIEYMADPKVGTRFIHNLTSCNIDMEQYNKAIDKYRDTTIKGQLDDIFDETKSAVRHIEELFLQDLNLKQKYEKLMLLFEQLKNARDLLKGIKNSNDATPSNTQ